MRKASRNATCRYTLRTLASYQATLALSADTRETLRACDVDRVMAAAHRFGSEYLDGFRAWVLGGFGSYAYGTCARIVAWRPETTETPAAPTVLD